MNFDKDGVLGLGLKHKKQSPSGSASRDVDENHVSHESEEKERGHLAHLATKPLLIYLSLYSILLLLVT